jgi:hypothetical protein
VVAVIARIGALCQTAPQELLHQLVRFEARDSADNPDGFRLQQLHRARSDAAHQDHLGPVTFQSGREQTRLMRRRGHLSRLVDGGVRGIDVEKQEALGVAEVL